MSLFEAFESKHLSLKNRIVMAPMTRQRATADGVPTSHVATYYAQRASAGLIITEATPISPTGVGYPNVPGIYTDAQIDGWLHVTQSVHNAGGKIFLQLWHVGRISHSAYQPGGARPIAPSAIRPSPELTCYLPDGTDVHPEPRAMTLDDIEQVIQDYASAAQNALRAGFDGVELHCANGYLIDQFLRDATNQRRDQYGGSINNRLRFMQRTLAAIVHVVGCDKLGVKISPVNSFNEISDSDPFELFSAVVAMLNDYDLAYLDVAEGVIGSDQAPPEFDFASLRKQYNGVYMANGGYTCATGQVAIADGRADLIAYGAPFIANPDLVDRFAGNFPLNEVDYSTCYSGGEKGYIDYPTLN